MASRRELIHAMNKAGLRLDDAAVAAAVALRAQRAERDALIAQARQAGLSYRQIAKITGMTKSQAQRVCTQRVPLTA